MMSTVRLLLVTAALIWPVAESMAGEAGYYAQPTLHGDRLVFVSEGDLWSVDVSAPPPLLAHRLTSGDGEESLPVLSPNGQWLAFTAEYDGNSDVYVMPAEGGAPHRLTFHPGPDHVLAWSSDDRNVLFRSRRVHPLGRWELFRIGMGGGMPLGYDFGECSMISLSVTGRRFAFTRWSNERFHWKRYRGGQAADIWVGDLNASGFQQLTWDAANDQFPMWLMGRVFFASDRSGVVNLFSDAPTGGDLKQHTRFEPDPADPTAIEGYDVRWPAKDTQRRGQRIVFCQGGRLALLDATTDQVQRLDVQLVSDRVSARPRFEKLMATASEFDLSPTGDRVLVGGRGELVSVGLDDGAAISLTDRSDAREWGGRHLGENQVVLISDAEGEQQIATVAADGTTRPLPATEDREAWLFPPAASEDGIWVAFGDKTGRLHLLNMQTLSRQQVDASDVGEITDYRFSPDGQWLAYTMPRANWTSSVMIYSLRTRRSFEVSDGLFEDTQPRWDPAGKYLYFLSERRLSPVFDTLDFEHAYLSTTRLIVVPLRSATPPPTAHHARVTDMDLEAWASGDRTFDQPEPTLDDDGNPIVVVDGANPIGVQQIDTDDLGLRQFVYDIKAGNFSDLEAVAGGVMMLERPTVGALDQHDEHRSTNFGVANAALVHVDIADDRTRILAVAVPAYRVGGAAGSEVVCWPAADGQGFVYRDLRGEAAPEAVEIPDVRIRVDVQTEWSQILEEAWRLQRDFFWASNMLGIDWPAIGEKYRALLPRVGTRQELNDVVGEMLGELGTSHTYIWGGDRRDSDEPISTGMLGIDVAFDGQGFKITRVLPGRAWDHDYHSPLDGAHLGELEGQYIQSINGRPLDGRSNIYDLLQDQAGKQVHLGLVTAEDMFTPRHLTVRTLESERRLRYAAWVESNRNYVAEATEGVVGYLHIPDMAPEGLAMFRRFFNSQSRHRGLIIDIRDNGGGFVSQLILQRLARRVLGMAAPRHGTSWKYPAMAPYAHMVALIDEHAGSDGDIFPANFRRLGLGPLIGTRTWGGVVGIRGDKPFVDMGISTQPEFAWWDLEEGWTIENQGVSPDIEVEITPADRAAGRDVQLDRAIEAVLASLADDSKELPKPPPFPAR